MEFFCWHTFQRKVRTSQKKTGYFRLRRFYIDLREKTHQDSINNLIVRHYKTEMYLEEVSIKKLTIISYHRIGRDSFPLIETTRMHGYNRVRSHSPY